MLRRVALRTETGCACTTTSAPFELQAKIGTSLRPGQVVVYHAWEPYQFKGRRSPSTVTPNPINPISLAGGYFHLQNRFLVGGASSTDRATYVEVERISGKETQVRPAHT